MELIEKLKKQLSEEYGIHSDQELMDAIAHQKPIDIGVFVKEVKLTPTNKNFYGSCKEVAGKAGVHSGTVGTFTFIAQFILSAKGYYTGAMDASCGSKLVEAITAFQKANGLDADGWCGADTWYALFN